MSEPEHTYTDGIHFVAECAKCQADLDTINNPPFASPETASDESNEAA